MCAIAMFGLLALTLGPLKAAGSPLFLCPVEDGVCEWTAEGWRSLYQIESELGDIRVGFERIGEHIVLLLRGHSAPGVLVILDSTGSLIAVMELSTGRQLLEVTGDWDGKALVVCNGLLGEATCDLTLTHALSEALLRQPVPSGCLFPRLVESRVLCLAEVPRPTVLLAEDGVIVDRVELLEVDSAMWVDNFWPIGQRSAFIESGGRLLLWERNGTFVVSDGKVLWSVQGSDNSIYYAECAYVDGELGECLIYRASAGGKRELVWDGERGQWPERLEVSGGDALLLDLRSDQGRMLVRLGDRERAPARGTVVWRGEN